MSEIAELKRRLETAAETIEALDADRVAGRLGADEHARQRAEREREAGQIVVSLRRAQREARGPRSEPPVETAEPGPRRTRSAVPMAAAAVVLVSVGAAAGVTVWRWFNGAPGAGAPAGISSPAAAGGPSATLTETALRALGQAAPREDAPIPTLLQSAHHALDQGRLDEARRVYEGVLAREPRDVEAITHLGGVLFQEGRVDEALAKVEAALRIDPRYVHAHWDRTQYLFHGKRDFPAALKAAEAFLELVPEGPDADAVRTLVAEARRQAAGSAPRVPKAR